MNAGPLHDHVGGRVRVGSLGKLESTRASKNGFRARRMDLPRRHRRATSWRVPVLVWVAAWAGLRLRLAGTCPPAATPPTTGSTVGSHWQVPASARPGAVATPAPAAGLPLAPAGSGCQRGHWQRAKARLAEMDRDSVALPLAVASALWQISGAPLAVRARALSDRDRLIGDVPWRPSPRRRNP